MCNNDSATGSVNGDNSIGTTVGNIGGSVAVSINRSPPLTFNVGGGQNPQIKRRRRATGYEYSSW